MSIRNRRLRLPDLQSTLVAVALVLTGTTAPGQGVVVTPIGTAAEWAETAVILPSGALFAAGRTQGTTEDHAAATYPLNPKIGAPTVRTTFYNPQNNTANVDYASSSVVVGGDVVTAGVAYTLNDACPARFVGNFAITWWNASGAYRKVETAFNPDRKGRPTTKSKAVEILLAADGSLVAVGVDEYNGSRLAMARYNPATGALLGKRLSSIDFGPRGATLQGNRVLAVGRTLGTGQLALVRTDLDGKVDTGWGAGGMVVLPMGDESLGEAVALDGLGRIVVAGWAVYDDDRRAVVARFHPDGTPDAAFGPAGVVTTDLGGTDDVYTAVKLRANGLVVATGFTSTLIGGVEEARFAATQYRDDGALDAGNFGDGGIALIPINASAKSYDSRLQADGRLVLIGESRTIVQVSPRRTNCDFAAVQLDLMGRP